MLFYIWHAQFTHAATVIALMNLKSFIPALNQLLGEEDVFASANYISLWRLLFGLKPWPPYPRENSPQ